MRVLVVIPDKKLDVIEILLHVLLDGPPLRVVTLLLPELKVVENDANVGLNDMLKSFEQDEVESNVLELPNCNLRPESSVDYLIHSFRVISGGSISGFC